MPLPTNILHRINVLIAKERSELNLQLDQLNQSTHPKNLLDALHLIRQDQQLFLRHLLQLIDEIKKIVFREIHTKHLTESFSAIRLDIQQLIDPLITDFNNKCRALLQAFVPKEDPKDLVISDFERQLDREISEVFVRYEDEFPSLLS